MACLMGAPEHLPKEGFHHATRGKMLLKYVARIPVNEDPAKIKNDCFHASRLFRHEREHPLALAGFEAWVDLVDHVKAAFTAHDTAVFVALGQRLERIADFHRIGSLVSRRRVTGCP